MQKLKKTDFLLKRANFRRFTTSFQSMIHDGIIDGQIVQYAPAEGIDQIMGCASARVRLKHIRFPHEACVRTGQANVYVTFTLPLNAAERLTVNGVAGGTRTLFINFGLDETQIYAPNRNLIAGGVKTDFLLETLGALGGCELDETSIPRGAFPLSPATYDHTTGAFLHAIYASNMFDDVISVENSVATALAAALISAPVARIKPSVKYTGIFITAHQYIRQHTLSALSVAALCDVCGVSAPTLMYVFRQITGRTPMQYAKYVKLAEANHLMVNGRRQNKTVKAIASLTGFSELGRFSGHFRKAYGALPSAVLQAHSNQ